MEVLLDPPHGSPSACANRQTDPDFTTTRTPRPASAKEQRQLREIRRLQAEIAKIYPPGSEMPIHPIKHLFHLLGASWEEKLPLLQLATNTYDQGVRH